MWDFTHTCNPTNLPLTCESLPLCGLQDLFVGHEQILLTPPCLMGFSLHQCIIQGFLVRHPWEPRVNPARISMGCWAFLFFLFSPGSLCVGHLGFLYPRWVGTINTSPPSPHTTWLWYHLLGRDKHLGGLPWVINITYKDTLQSKRPKPNEYVLNYVILTTHSSHLYSMWDSTHTCNPTRSARDNFKTQIVHVSSPIHNNIGGKANLSSSFF